MKNNLINSNDWSKNDLENILDIASQMTDNEEKYSSILKNQTFAMNFNAPSTRTQISFHASIAELGGTSYFIDPKTMHNESITDFVKILTSYCCAYGIRLPNPGDIFDTKEGKKIWRYGASKQFFDEMEQIEEHLPIISLRHDDGHPCQGLYELKTYKEALDLTSYSEMKGKKLLITWTKGKKVKPWSPTLETIKIASKFGMNITLCNPDEFSLDKNIIKKCKTDAKTNGGRLIETNDFVNSFTNQDIVYGRNWVSSEFNNIFSTKNSFIDELDYDGIKDIREKTVSNLEKLNENYKDRIVTRKHMAKTKMAKFINPMPIEKDIEVEAEIWDDPKVSLQLPLLKNKLYIQKAVLAYLTKSIFS